MQSKHEKRKRLSELKKYTMDYKLSKMWLRLIDILRADMWQTLMTWTSLRGWHEGHTFTKLTWTSTTYRTLTTSCWNACWRCQRQLLKYRYLLHSYWWLKALSKYLKYFIDEHVRDGRWLKLGEWQLWEFCGISEEFCGGRFHIQ